MIPRERLDGKNWRIAMSSERRKGSPSSYPKPDPAYIDEDVDPRLKAAASRELRTWFAGALSAYNMKATKVGRKYRPKIDKPPPRIVAVEDTWGRVIGIENIITMISWMGQRPTARMLDVTPGQLLGFYHRHVKKAREQTTGKNQEDST
jgi:hypothetical protein